MKPLSLSRWAYVGPCLCAGILIVGFATSCASILHGTLQPLAVSSTPTGATVTVDGTNMGNTPVTASLSRKHEHTVKLELKGYKAAEVHLNKKIDGWFWGNILFGGVIGMVIDGSSGAMYKLTPTQPRPAVG